MNSKVTIVSGSQSTDLGKKIAEKANFNFAKLNFTEFSDGEFQPSFEETIRGHDIFIIQSTHAPTRNLMEVLLTIDAAKRASAKRIVAILPYFGFARQDRKDKPRVPIGAKLMANLLQAAGVDRVVSMDLHADQIQGFFDVPFDHMYASSLFVPYLKELDLPDLVMASPDTGGTKRAAAYAKFLNTELVISFKQRKKANEVDEMRIIGDVEGKNVVLIDDIIDTAGTISKASHLMKEQGAKSVMAMCTHAVFSGKAYENINNSALDRVIVTDSIPIKKGKSDKIEVVSIVPLFADVIHRITEYKSISEYFEFTTIL